MRPRLSLFLLIVLLPASLQVSAQVKFKLDRPASLFSRCDTVSVFIIGDVMMHKRQLEYDCEYFLHYIEPAMQEPDICVANMEFALGGRPYTGYPAFSAPDYYADYLARCGTDVFLLANNHILDKRTAGLRRSLDVYSGLKEKYGVQYTGVGAEPLVLRRRGVKIAFVNFTYGTNMPPTEKEPDVLRMNDADVSDCVGKAKASGADFIVALPHWGEEYVLRHVQWQEIWARKLVELGCDAIVGAHPHVAQDTLHVKGVPVIFSLGNAVSNMSAVNTRLELAVTLRFVHNRYSDEKYMLEPQLDWMWCTLPGKLTSSYATIFVKDWEGRRNEWLDPSDYDNMIATLKRATLNNPY